METPINICIITQQLKNIFSGPGTYSKLLIQKLIEDGHIVHVILPQSQLPINPNFSYQTVPNPKIKSHARWIELSTHFNGALKKSHKNFDLIHCTDIHDSYFIKTSTPLISNINDTYATKIYPLSYLKENYSDWFQRYFYYAFTRFVEKHMIDKNNAIISNSGYTKKTLIEKYPFIQKKTYTCYKTINLKHSSNINLHESKPNFNILFIGGNMERKGLATVIKSAPKVIKNINNVKYFIIGRDPKTKYYKKTCEDLGVDTYFDFMGNISPELMSDYFQLADIFVMPSLDEALGIVFLEAMASHVPVIGTNIGGIPEIIKNNENGILITPNDFEELTNKILLLKNDRELRINLINNGVKTLEKFSIESMLNCTYKIYSNLLRNTV